MQWHFANCRLSNTLHFKLLYPSQLKSCNGYGGAQRRVATPPIEDWLTFVSLPLAGRSAARAALERNSKDIPLARTFPNASCASGIEELLTFFDRLTPERYQAMSNAVQKLPQSQWADSMAECQALVNTLKGYCA